MVRRGRGMTTSGAFHRQHSTGGVPLRSNPMIDPQIIPPMPSLRRSPSLTQPTRAPPRTLARSQSTASPYHSRPSSPSHEAPMPDLMVLRDATANARNQMPQQPFGPRYAVASNPPSPAISRNTSYNMLPSLRSDSSHRPLAVDSQRAHAVEPQRAYAAESQRAQAPVTSAPLATENGATPQGPDTSPQAPEQNAAARQQAPEKSPAAKQQPLHEHYHISIQDLVMDDLFQSFSNQADAKIDNCADSRSRNAGRIEDICAKGVDQSFDQLLANMGFVTRSNPRPLIDKLMGWKQDHDSRRVPVAKPLPPPPDTPKEQPKKSLDLSRSRPSNNRPPTHYSEAEQTELRASAATYILCRALIEILSQTNLNAVSKDVTFRLERITFDGTVNMITRDEMQRFSIKRAKWEMAVELLGVLSTLDFTNVIGLYAGDLKKIQNTLADRGINDVTLERKACNLLKGLRAVRPRAQSEYDRMAAYAGIRSLVDLFLDTHGEQMKTEYIATLEILLLRTAASSQSAFDDPKWRKMVVDLQARLVKMASKPKYWQVAFPCLAALACASPNDIFQSRWQAMMDSASKHLREKQTKLPQLKALCRLTWCYLRRRTEGDVATLRAIEELTKAVFFSGKKYSLAREPETIEALIQLIRIVGSVLATHAFRSIVFPLMNADQIIPSRDPSISSLEPDRIVVGIRSFLALIGDIESKTNAPFPLHIGPDEDENPEDLSIGAAVPATPGTRGRPRKASLLKGERLSEPVSMSNLSEVNKANYSRFCDILGKIIKICDNQFGGQASLDEKFAAPSIKTPLSEAWSFARRDDLLQNDDARLGHYDLLHVSVQALPRCLSNRLSPSNELINLLCTGTAHVERDIASSSAISLKAIAKQGWAQDVVDRFSAFIFKYESRYATMSDGGLLGPGHIESTLRLYVELLEIWTDELHRKRSRPQDPTTLDMAASHTYVERVEAQGLFFLCSPSNKVRAFALEVFELVTKLDKARGEDHPRIFHAFSETAPPIVDMNSHGLFFKDFVFVERGMKKGNINGDILDLCKSSEIEFGAMWCRVFPHVIRAAEKLCPLTISQTRQDVCSRLLHLQSIIEASDGERHRTLTVSTNDSSSSRAGPRTSVGLTDMTIEQWKLYLIFACTTVTRIEPMSTAASVQSPTMDTTHERQASKSSHHGPESMSSATDLFGNVVPLLSSADRRVAAAAVAGLGSANVVTYTTLLESLAKETRSERRQGQHIRTASSPRRDLPTLPTYNEETLRVYESTAHFLEQEHIYSNENALHHMAGVTRDVSRFLSKESGPGVRSVAMKAYFCGLIEHFYSSTLKTADPLKWMSFSARKAVFVQIETCWEDATHLDPTVRADSKAQQQMQLLKFAAANALAALCAGPLHIKVNGQITDQFQSSRILGLIDVMLNTDGNRTHVCGRRALKNIIRHNRDIPELLESTIEKLYEASRPVTLDSYLEVLIDVYDGIKITVDVRWKLISILLFILGSPSENTRMQALKLLRILENQHGSTQQLRNYDIRVSDKTRAVNIAAQYNLVEDIIFGHEDRAYLVFSEYSRHFVDLPVESKRSMIHIMLPWMKKMELQVDSRGLPTPTTRMVLLNMLMITVKCATGLHHEIQALWHGLIDGKYTGNAKAIIDFVISLALESKNEAFVKVARQIIVHMASHEGGKGIYEYLLANIRPQAMKDHESQGLVDLKGAAVGEGMFAASLSQILASSSNKIGMSMGQLSLMLMVDLVVERYVVPIDKFPLLLHAVLVLWDHHLPIVQEAAREMLVHLIHVLVIAKVDKSVIESRQPSVEALVDLIRRHDPKVGWEYGDNMTAHTPYELPTSMPSVVQQAVSLFNITMPGIAETLGPTAIYWATNCVVRHQACRSWQIYRCLLTGLDSMLLSQMFGQLSGTISDANSDMQAYSMDIIRVMRTIAEREPADSAILAQVFWAMLAIMYSIHEHEFRENMNLLGLLLDKLNLANPEVRNRLESVAPRGFDPDFTGVRDFLLCGFRSLYSCDYTLTMFDRLLALPSSTLIGHQEQTLRFAILANMPRWMHSFDDASVRAECSQTATTVVQVCKLYGHSDMARTLEQFRDGGLRDRKGFLASWFSSAKSIYHGESLAEGLRFTMSLLHNPLIWMRWEVLRLLGSMVSLCESDTRDFSTLAPEFFQPLLALTSTEYCGEALRIIDRIMPPSSNPHPSAVQPAPQPAPEYYGKPSQTGWSVPNASTRRIQCRKNLEALYEANYVAKGNSDETHETTPSREFQQDYFTSTSDDELSAYEGMRDDRLEDFFEVEESSATEIMSDEGSQRSRAASVDDFFARDSVQYMAPPQQQQRTFESTTPPRKSSVAGANTAQQPIMSPSAFATGTGTIKPHVRLPARPALLTRSVTMPVADASDAPPSQVSTPLEFPQSDDEAPWSSPHSPRKHEHLDAGSASDASARPEPSSTSSKSANFFRSLSMKRRANNASANADRLRRVHTGAAPVEPPEPSPRVPRVPAEYLNSPPRGGREA